VGVVPARWKIPRVSIEPEKVQARVLLVTRTDRPMREKKKQKGEIVI